MRIFIFIMFGFLLCLTNLIIHSCSPKLVLSTPGFYQITPCLFEWISENKIEWTNLGGSCPYCLVLESGFSNYACESSSHIVTFDLSVSTSIRFVWLILHSPPDICQWETRLIRLVLVPSGGYLSQMSPVTLPMITGHLLPFFVNMVKRTVLGTIGEVYCGYLVRKVRRPKCGFGECFFRKPW